MYYGEEDELPSSK